MASSSVSLVPMPTTRGCPHARADPAARNGGEPPVASSKLEDAGVDGWRRGAAAEKPASQRYPFFPLYFLLFFFLTELVKIRYMCMLTVATLFFLLLSFFFFLTELVQDRIYVHTTDGIFSAEVRIAFFFSYFFTMKFDTLNSGNLTTQKEVIELKPFCN